jgi:hypothetical protein
MFKRMPIARIGAHRTQEIANVVFSAHTSVNNTILPIPPCHQCDKSSDAHQLFSAEYQSQSMRTEQVRIPKLAVTIM